MEFEDGSGRRKPASAEEKAQDASTDRFEKRMENDPAKIQAHATFEKCLRTILKEREIPMSDADISKVMGIRSGAATGVKTYIEGKLAIEDMRRLDTIDNTVDYRMNNGIREIVLPLTGADGTHKARLGLGALGEEFLRRRVSLGFRDRHELLRARCDLGPGTCGHLASDL